MNRHRTPSPAVASILRDLASVMIYHASSGIDVYPLRDGVAEFLRSADSLIAQSETVADPMPAQKGELRQPQPVVRARKPEPDKVAVPVATLADIAAEVATCRACPLAESRIVPVAGTGGRDVQLLIAGDWLSVEKGRQVPTGCVFGIEQDRMLARMLDAIKLPRNQVFVSNVIKCGIPDAVQPKAEHVHACLSFLHRQIGVLRPKAILTMGMIATRALLNRNEPLSRLRGRLHCFEAGDLKIPLIATYHPTYLLQNPEMKKATWVDLQMLAKQLGID